MAVVRVELSGARETMLGTLWGRAEDSRLPQPILGDKAAADAADRLEYDFRKASNANLTYSVALRAKAFDSWLREALEVYPDATVLHLGCGLDTRLQRIDPPASVRWFDVDFPEIGELRRQLFPELATRENYRLIESSVTDPAWLAEVPADRPVIMVAEGLTMYLHAEEAEALIRAIVARFPSGEMIFDVFSRLGIKLQKLNPVVRRSGSTLHWGVNDSRELERFGIQVIGERFAGDFASSEDVPRLPASIRKQLAVLRHFGPVNRMGRIVRCRF